MMNGTSPSLADIAAVTRDDNNNNFGNEWWVWIILFALFGGWGGNWNREQNCATSTELQNGFDTQSILNKLNGINSGLCDGFYAMNTGMLQGSFGTQQAINDAKTALQQAVNDANITAMQNTNAVQTQLSSCCCENREAIAQVRYDMATDTCAVTTAISDAARDITENANANYRALHDEFVQYQIDAKNEKIAEQASLIQALNLAQSQANQNQYLIQQLRPAAVPAFNVPNPYSTYGYGCYCNSATV